MASSDDVGGMTVEAGDVAELAAYQYVGFLSSSLQAIMRDRDLALVALEACAPMEHRAVSPRPLSVMPWWVGEIPAQAGIPNRSRALRLEACLRGHDRVSQAIGDST